MSTSNSERQSWLNPAILKWAREWRGRSLEEAAKKLNQSIEKIQEWERGVSTPTVIQARKLAEFYERPFVEFFLDEKPQLQPLEPITDFRLYSGVPDPNEAWEVRDAQRWAESVRDSYIFLQEQLGYEVPAIPEGVFSTLDEDEEEASWRVREAIHFPISEQLSINQSKAYTLPDVLRHHLELSGMLVLRRSELKNVGVRGLCVFRSRLPVIVYSAEATSAQSFTIGHELGHIALKQSGITGTRTQRAIEHRVEKWCDNFSSAFLMPKPEVRTLVGSLPSKPREEIGEEELSPYANYFRVSAEAMLIRLVKLGYVRPAYYWETMYPIYRARAKDLKTFARSKYYGSRYYNAVGDKFSRLVVEAWASGAISNHNAAEFMGIKNLKHLYDIRDAMVA